MALTVSAFMSVRAEYSEVYAANPERVEAAVAAAVRQTDPEIFLDDTDEAAMWLAAHILSADPLGKDARVIGKKAVPLESGTLYLQERARLEALYAAGYGLALG